MSTETKAFTAIGVLVVITAGIYWWTSYEDAGTTMLLLAGLLALTIGAYLWLKDRERTRLASAAEQRGAAEAPVEGAGAGEGAGQGEASGMGTDQPWLPHASIWPFWIGVGSLLVANGLILGSWFLIPGGLVFALGVGGFAAESRARR